MPAMHDVAEPVWQGVSLGRIEAFATGVIWNTGRRANRRIRTKARGVLVHVAMCLFFGAYWSLVAYVALRLVMYLVAWCLRDVAGDERSSFMVLTILCWRPLSPPDRREVRQCMARAIRLYGAEIVAWTDDVDMIAALVTVFTDRMWRERRIKGQ